MSNPAMNRIPAFSNRTLTADELREMYSRPAVDPRTATPGHREPAQEPARESAQHPHAGAHTDGDAGFPGAPVGSATPMTYESTIHKTTMLFLLLLASAAVAWFVPVLLVPGAVAALVLAMVNIFKRVPSPALIMLYAAAEGLFLGGFSSLMERLYPGIVMQAVMGTLLVFGVTLVLFRNGKVRSSSRLNKIVMVAAVGYLLFSVVNIVLMATGLNSDPWGLRSSVEVFGIPLGVIIGALAVLLAAYSLVLDFESIQNGVERRVDDRYSWAGAFALMVTLVWLYTEILRVIAILRGND